MADTAIAITAGSGTNVDTRTEATNGNHRQVIVVGDPSTNAGVAPVDATAGLKVDLGADNDVTITGTVAVTDNSGSLTVDNSTLSVVGGGTEAAALRVTVASDSTGVLSVDDNGGSLTVDNAGTFVVQENGAALTSLQLIDDTVYTDGTGTVSKGIAVFGQDGTNPQAIKTDANGELQVDVLTMPTVQVQSNSANIATETTVNSIKTAVEIMDDWDNAASDGASVSGDVAHDSPDAGEPVKIGMKAYELDGTAPQTAVAEADRVNAISDLVGRQYVATEHPRFWHVSADYGSAQTNTSVKAAPGVGLALYITDIMISNGATAGNVTLLDGSGGTVLFEVYPAVNGGAVLNLKNPIKLTDNTALCITSTTVTTHSVFVSGFID